MDSRDDLAAVLLDQYVCYRRQTAERVAEKILAAGWVPGELYAAEQARNATLTDTIQATRALVDDWDANGNSRELSDPCPYVWYQCARELLAALGGPGEEDG